MTQDVNLLSFIFDAGLLVKLVLFILVAASIYSWTLIFQRRKLYKGVSIQSNDFEERFKNTSDAELNKLYHETDQDTHDGMIAIFRSGAQEFAMLRKTKANADAVMQGTERVMRTCSQRELDKLEKNVSFLATVGSTAPYIGLFGTVWGIMTAFQSLGTVQQATIAMVAPGISEALIATAMGLFAAIPAVIAYNRYNQKLHEFHSQFHAFQEDFLAVLYRKLFTEESHEQTS